MTGAWLFAVALAATGAGPESLFPNGVHPIDGAGAAPAAACARCHRAIHEQWKDSRHGRSWTNSIFQTEYSFRPRAWCVNCHAPSREQQQALAAGATPGDGSLADDGISCAVCHLRDGRMLARTKAASSPHDTRSDPDYGSPQFCAGCHEFAFPRFDAGGSFLGYTEQPMQATVSEFTHGPFAELEQGCNACHARSPADHRYPGAHTEEQLLRALKFAVCRNRAGMIETLVANAGAGHPVPTGDVHRHLVLRLWRSSAPERVLEANLRRTFESDPAGGNRLVADTRLAPRVARTYVASPAVLGGEPGEAINVELRYVYIAEEDAKPPRAPTEPAWRILYSQREALAGFAACEASAGASAGFTLERTDL